MSARVVEEAPVAHEDPVSVAARGWTPHTVLLVGGLISLAAAVLLSAWVSDDALISLRTIDHLLHGRGLRFNAIERVQAFTHPLWLFWVTPFQALTGEGLIAPVLAGVVCTGAAVWLGVVTCGRRGAGAWVVVLTLVSSKSFVDYSTSGLENPLTHLLLAVFAFFWLSEAGERTRRQRVGVLALTTALIFTNRMDALLLVAPSALWLASRVWRDGQLRAVLPTVAFAIAPALLWLAFAWLYYGSPWPNTAYSKLSTGIEREALLRQGLAYFEVFGRLDLAGALVLVCGLIVGFTRAHAAPRCFAAGGVLYCAYVLWIGGDFMAGRFFAAPVFMAALLLGHAVQAAEPPWHARFVPAIVGVAVLLSASSVDSPLRVSTRDTYARIDPAGLMPPHGIVDERLWYYTTTGVFSVHRTDGIAAGASCDGEPRVIVRDVCGGLGERGFAGCAGDHWVDPCGLTDAFLARQPIDDRVAWRIGHFKRRVPPGYRASIVRGRALLGDARLDAEFERALLRGRVPIFEPARLREILRHPLGGPSGARADTPPSD